MGNKKRSIIKVKTPEAPPNEPEEFLKAPHSFVIHRGTIGKYVMQLMKDFRKVMEPFTASSLKAKKKNCIKDFVSISSVLNVSHMSVFTLTDASAYMRVVRLPQGPTLTFRIHDYALSRDVVSSLRKQYTHSKSFQHSPLVVLNGFSGDSPQIKLVATMLQSMFPTLNIAKLKLNSIKRCALFNYNEETKTIEFRHYIIRVTPTGLNRGVKKLVLGKIPNMAKYNDVSDLVTKAELLSDASEPEDEGSQVVLPQMISSKGNYTNNTSAIRLTELGPRLTLQLVKVEAGVMDGEVMFHEYVHKTPKEIDLMRKQRRNKKRLKDARRREQEMNVRKKEEAKAANKERSLEGMRRKWKVEKDDNAVEQPTSTADGSNQHADEEEDDDAEWYRKEVGREPEPELFDSPKPGSKRKGSAPNRRNNPIKKGRWSSKSVDRDRTRDKGRGKRPRLGTGKARFLNTNKKYSRFTERDNYTDRNQRRFTHRDTANSS